eukprot:TRINITY_DN26058_c0_g1_i1.p1 TRINITY_DN26058_c0_g1~~TRINITY_DN26058_c0_g1_i1.p1  ORF type:complete len:521 (+),score=121.13 TRINITY_DN26058_c0_g1_i1:125-1564(+)
MPASKALVNPKRCRALNKVSLPEKGKGGTVIYWMSRDQRAQDNWALLRAQELALQYGASLHVVFCLVPKFLDATIRHFDFMLRGLHETATELIKLGISFELRFGQAQEEIPKIVKAMKPVHALVCDFAPLRVPMLWSKGVADKLSKQGVPVVQVDAHNVVPVWEASDKQEVGARTIRKKITSQYKEYLVDFPAMKKHPHKSKAKAGAKAFDLKKALAYIKVDRSVAPCTQFTPGTAAGLKRLSVFLKTGLKAFDTHRNNPTVDALSNLSPWIHFGQIAGQRCALAVRKIKGAGAAGFLEELVVRRELADNFCFYNPKYDSLEGAAQWAQDTLKKHTKDKREYVYTRQQLDKAQTHDELWNAAQKQLVVEGKMHGFLRMYWAKKILEWMKTPKDALETSIYLNDRYSIDGRDPNGYVGCMWSICGVHDMGWTERKIFGKIRYMNYEGCKRKFNVASMEGRYQSVAADASGGAAAKRRKTE